MAKSSSKTTRASKKKLAIDENTKQTHGALAPQPTVNMMKLFGINDGYDGVETIDDYRAKLSKMTITDLHEHAHRIGIVPLDSKDKLTASLERKFQETKLRNMPHRPVPVKTNPAMAEFMKKFQSGEIYNIKQS